MSGSFLAVQQALRVLAVSLLAAVLFLGANAYWLSQSIERDFDHLREATAISLRSGLAKALWNFDEPTAHAIISDAMHAKPIRSIMVTDSNGQVFSSVASQTEHDTSVPWYAVLEWILKPKREQTITLYFSSSIDADYVSVNVGKVFIAYDHFTFIRQISDRLTSQTLGLLFIVLVVAGATSLVMHRFLSCHILTTAQRVEDIDPEDPNADPLPVPKAHRRNEFGRMLRRFNSLLDRMAKVQSELRHLATRDSLTDLPNRSLILEILDRNIEDASLRTLRSAVVFLDLDMFKHVNDSLGHGAGDEILKEIGRRLEDVVAGQGTAGRLGGDEFVVTIDSYEREGDLARIARHIISAVARPVEMGGTLVQPSTSVGIACYPQDGGDAQTLLRNADTAMYAAKASGPGQWAFFDRSMTENALIRLRTEGSLRQAVENEEFVLYFQPKLDMISGRVIGCEALIRWEHGGELISPGRFIPIAEETGLIYDIGLWVLKEACLIQSRWKDQVGALSMAINVSPNQLKQERFIDDFTDVLRSHRVDLDHLELEITETAIMSQFDISAQLLRKIKAFGVRLAVDDFGTGYSSLAYLKNLPIDVLKIDRSFVSDLPGDTSIPRMIIGLSGQLGLRTVAEGIETQEQFDWLRENGCHLVQGYLISPPLPEDKFLEFVKARNTAAEAVA